MTTKTNINDLLNIRKKAVEEFLELEKEQNAFINAMIGSLAFDISNLGYFFKGQEGFDFIIEEITKLAKEIHKTTDKIIFEKENDKKTN